MEALNTLKKYIEILPSEAMRKVLAYLLETILISEAKLSKAWQQYKKYYDWRVKHWKQFVLVV